MTAPIAPAQLIRRRVPRALARRIDRLAVRAHGFHRWAHHPLCGAYAGEVIRLGRARVCRGCAYAAIGGAAGGIAGLAAPATLDLALAIAAGAALVLAASIAWRRWLGAARRPPKLITRLAPATALAFAIASAVHGGARGAIAAASIAGAALALFAIYRRRGNDRAPCVTCPERDDRPCSGFAPIVRRERAFQRLTARWLRDAGL